MRKLLLLFFFCLFTSFLNAQENFRIKWKVGTEKLIVRSLIQKVYDNDELKKEATALDTFSIKVVGETKHYYKFEYAFGQKLRDFIRKNIPDASESLLAKADLTILYGVYKETAELKVLNWKEIREYARTNVEFIKRKLLEREGMFPAYVNISLNEILMPLATEERAISFFESDLGLLLLPFHHEYRAGDTIRDLSIASDPLARGEEIECTTALSLLSHDTLGGINVIYYGQGYDLAPFINKLKKYKQEELEKNSVDGVEKTLEQEKINSIDIRHNSVQNVFFNKQSTWVEKIVGQDVRILYVPDEGKNKRIELNMTFTVE